MLSFGFFLKATCSVLLVDFFEVRLGACQFSYAVNETTADHGPHEIPAWTIFNCAAHPPGLYADTVRDCHVFYLCTKSGLKFPIVCPDNKLYSEKEMDCVGAVPGNGVCVKERKKSAAVRKLPVGGLQHTSTTPEPVQTTTIADDLQNNREIMNNSIKKRFRNKPV